MKLRELLTTVDQLHPNAFTDGEKIRMVNTVEGRIYKDILSKYEGEEPVFVPFAEGQEERELAVPVPFTDVYVFYLASMMDFYNGDSGRYNDSMVLYNQAWEEFQAHYLQTHTPKQTNLCGMIPLRGW